MRGFVSVPEDSACDDDINNDDDDDDACSTCESVYSVGEVSVISEDNEDDTFTCGLLTDGQDDRGLFASTEVSTNITQEERDGARNDMVTEPTNDEEMDVTEANENTVPEGDEMETGSQHSTPNTTGNSSLAMEVTTDRVTETHQTTTRNPGFVLVIDNIDMNVRPSEQRVDRTTSSYHFCHAFALQNRVNSTLLEDSPPSGVLSLDQILPSQKDLDIIMEEFQVFVSRYLIKLIIHVVISIQKYLHILEYLLRMCSSLVERRNQ